MIKTPEGHAYRGVSHGYFSLSTLIGGYRARYPECYDFTLAFEGGYVNDPNDPGGCTNRGITIGTLQVWRDDPTVDCSDVASLTTTETALIYATNYWQPVWGNELPVGLNLQVWDWGVNSGPSRAIRSLQEMTGASADGIMGPNTLQAVTDFCARYGVTDAVNEYAARRQAYYESLSTFDIYGNGWTARNEACADTGREMAVSGPKPIPAPPTPAPGIDPAVEARLSALEAWASSYPANRSQMT